MNKEALIAFLEGIKNESNKAVVEKILGSIRDLSEENLVNIHTHAHYCELEKIENNYKDIIVECVDFNSISEFDVDNESISIVRGLA